jgi:O-antigen biosynthesis protein
MENIFTLPARSSNLAFTGERFVPHVTGEIELEHIHRYLFSVNACKDKRVLDIASGEGYGSFILAQCAKKVTGIDVDEESVKNANKSYSSSSLEFLMGSCQKIPMADSSVEVVVSFETLEHIVEHDDFMKEIKRVLCPGGILIMSTPDTDIYSNGQPTQNEYHLKELTLVEINSLMKTYFKNVHLFCQKCIAVSSIQNLDHLFLQNPSVHSSRYFNPDAERVKMGYSPERIPYLLAVASDVQIEDKILSNNFFVSPLNVNDLLVIDARHQEYSECLATLQEDNKSLKNSLNLMLNSRSWKISAPLRVFKKFITKMVRRV